MFNSALVDLLTDFAAKLHDLHLRFLSADWKEDGFTYDNSLKTAAEQLRKQISTLSEKFTTCLTGEFKVGKSTLLNGILGLSGDAALSAAESIDTACIITLCERCSGDPEARLIFKDRPQKDVTWKDARRYSSQVARNADPELEREAVHIEEIRYYFQNPLLHEVNLRDVPGTGTPYWENHSAWAIEAIKTSDVIVWLTFDEEPGAQGTGEFMDIVARHRRRVVPVVNVRQEPGEPAEMQKAREVAIWMQAYQRYFEEGIAAPLFYSARVAELERARPEPDVNVLEAAGYSALVDRLLGPAAVARRVRSKDTRVSNECAAILDQAALDISRMHTVLEEHRANTAEACRDFADRIDELSAIHIHLEADLRLLGEAYARASCDTIRDICSRFIDENLRADNWDALKIIAMEPTENLTMEFSRQLQRDYFDRDVLIPACEKRYQDNARHVVWSAWRAEKAWKGEVRAPLMPERGFRAADGSKMEDAIFGGMAKVAVTGLLVALVWVFQPFIVAAMPLGFYLLRNPMAKLRQEAKEAVGWEVNSWRVTLEGRFESAWSEESRRIKGVISEDLGAHRNAATSRFERFQSMCVEVGDLLSALRDIAQKLRGAREHRGTAA